MNGSSLAQLGLQGSLKSSSTSPTIQSIQPNSNSTKHINGNGTISTSNSINMALYQYDYHTKAAKFANQNSDYNNLFSTESSPQHIKQPLPPAGPPPNSRPEKTKSVVIIQTNCRKFFCWPN